MSANSTISSVAARTCAGVIPCARQPISMLRRPLSLGSSAALTPSSAARPPSQTCPDVGGTRPAMVRSRVDLPEPLRPMMPIDSPW